MDKTTCKKTVSVLPEPNQLRQTLGMRLPGYGQIEWLLETGSTNLDLGERIRSESLSVLDSLPWLRGAHLQTTGKGRAGRTWANESGQCLMFSVAMASPVPIARLVGLAPALGVATVLALRSLVCDSIRHRLSLKWPNDIFWDQAKLAGILLETVKHPSRPDPVVIAGIGLNLSGASRLSNEMGRAIADWTQVCDANGDRGLEDMDAGTLVVSVAHAWHETLERFAKLGFAGFIQDAESMDALSNQAVTVMDGGACLMQGVACGFDDLGRLLVRTSQGIQPVMVGDVSIRPASGKTGSAEG